MITEFWYTIGLAERPNKKVYTEKSATNNDYKELKTCVDYNSESANYAFRYYRRILSGHIHDVREALHFCLYRAHLFKNHIRH